MKQTPIDVSVIILNFNTKDLTRACLSSIRASKLGKYVIETIVVDNASTDDTDKMVQRDFPEVLFIQNGKNVGFAAGNNPGIRRAKGRFVLLLNSDTEVSHQAFAEMIGFMDTHPKCGAATVKLLLTDGTMDPACHRGFPTPWNAFTYYMKLEKVFPKVKPFAGYHQGYKDLSTPHEVDSISGAFFMVRKEVIEQVGMLDESYFMYAEDIDWAFRIKSSGWQIWFNPRATVLHRKKQSGRSHFLKDRRVTSHRYFLTYNRLFYTKNYEKKYSGFVNWLVYASFDVQLWFLLKLGIAL